MVAVVLVTLVTQALLVRTFVLLGNRESLYETTNDLTVVANAQRQALALQVTFERLERQSDTQELDVRIGLLRQQTRVMLVNTPPRTRVGRLLAVIERELDEVMAARDVLARTPRDMWVPVLRQARIDAAELEQAVKRLYDAEEVRIFSSVDRDEGVRQETQRAIVGLSAVVLLLGTIFVIAQRRRARSTVASAYAALLEEVADRERAERRFSVGFEQAASGIVISDLEGYPTMVNPAMAALMGRPMDELVGRRWDAFAHPEETSLGAEAIRRVAMGEDHYSDERRYLTPDGTVVWVWASVTLIRNAAGDPSYFFAQFQDITERKVMESELRHQALHDSLTELPNRTLLLDRLGHALALSRRRGLGVGVIFMDLDQFKLVNDALGHAAGDGLLRQVGERLETVVRGGDTVARLGGDEFVVLCEDIAPSELDEVARRISHSLDGTFVVQGHEVHARASLGVVMAAPDDEPDGVLRDADVAMYRAKELGRGRIQVFDADLRERASARFDIEAGLRRALRNDEFQVFYQPIIELTTQHVVGVEALVRWRTPDRGLVPPDVFIPVAESSGLIVPLGRWVLEEATRQTAQWRAELAGCEDFFVAVNLSARQLGRADLVEVVSGALDATALPPDALHLEITETVVMDDVERSIERLGHLRALGVHLAIDDFGTGYSSLSYLKRLPVDTLKVDRSFVDGLGTDAHDSSITQAIVGLGSALGLGLVAEGVETEVQHAALRTMRCGRAQGYLWSPPLCRDAFVAWLGARAAPASPTIDLNSALPDVDPATKSGGWVS
jgi:diguanylate cyclase (GGDEF)-like protein/PAS domain S-box-containing protein